MTLIYYLNALESILFTSPTRQTTIRVAAAYNYVYTTTNHRKCGKPRKGIYHDPVAYKRYAKNSMV